MAKKSDPDARPFEGTQAVADMLSAMDPESREKILREMGAREPATTEKVRRAMGGFDKVLKLTDEDLAILLREVPFSKLALALRDQPEEIHARFLACLPSRAAEAVREELETQGPQLERRIRAAQDEIAQIAIRVLPAKEGA